MKYIFLYRHSGNRMAITDVHDVRMSREHTDVRSDLNPELSKVYWIPDNSFAVSGMTLRIMWDSNGSGPITHKEKTALSKLQRGLL